MNSLSKDTLFLEITKVMTKVSKEGGCEVTEWVKPCGNNFYCSACSTHDGNGTVIEQSSNLS